MNANNLSCLIYCRCSLLLFAALGLTVTNHSFAAEEAEFDSEFLHLDKGINAIDIRRFSHGNPVPEGRYILIFMLIMYGRGRLICSIYVLPIPVLRRYA